MSDTTRGGPPQPAQLAELSRGLLPYSLVMDFVYLLSGDEAYANAAHESLATAALSGLAATVTKAASPAAPADVSGLPGAADRPAPPGAGRTRAALPARAQFRPGQAGLRRSERRAGHP